MENIKIACPTCNWEPDGKPYWHCSCGHQWNTFATGGRCPACDYNWEQTQCVLPVSGCSAWNPHLDWYKGLEDAVEEIKQQLELVPA